MKGSVDMAQIIRIYLNTCQESILVGSMNPLQVRGKADTSDKPILMSHCLQYVRDS